MRGIYLIKSPLTPLFQRGGLDCYFSEAFKDAQGEAEIATKRDIDDVRRDIDDLHRDMDARFIQSEQRLIIKLGRLWLLPLALLLHWLSCFNGRMIAIKKL